MSRREPGFVAKQPGVCVKCRNDYNPGDRIMPKHDGYMHVTCAPGQDDQ